MNAGSTIWLVAALWLAIALASAFISKWLRLPTAVCEIGAGAVACFALRHAGFKAFDPSASWVVFLAGAGTLLLTFLAGTELDADLLRDTWREAVTAGVVAFVVPFAAVGAAARHILHWTVEGSAIAALALSTASVSVTYTIMLDKGLHHTRLGRGLLTASYINNLCVVVAMGLVLAPFTWRVPVFAVFSLAIFAVLPFLSSRFFGRFRSRVSQPDIRYLLFLLFGLGGLAIWAGMEVVLPAYIMGMVLAGRVGRDATLIHNLRVVAFGILTPFYFIRAGAQVWLGAIPEWPLIFIVLLAAKLAAKLAGVMPVLRFFSYGSRTSAYYSLMISTGLGLGTIAASLGLARGILDLTQYSLVVGAVIASAVLPTTIANTFLLPREPAARQPVTTPAETCEPISTKRGFSI